MAEQAEPRSDAELVGLAAAGAGDAFSELYDRYFGGVYDFVYRVTGNRDDASDAAQDTFLQAMQSLGQLKNPGSFKSWLFSIAHHVALRRAQRERRSEAVAGLSSDADAAETDPLLQILDTDRTGSPEQAAAQGEMVSLVWQAAAALEANQYALLDLHVRQGLDSGEIATVLGVSKGNASTMLNRMRSAVEGSVASFLLARAGSKDCGDLDRLVSTASIPPVSPELRRAIERHTKRCDVCTRTRRRLVSPMELFAGLAAVPAPASLQSDLWSRLEPRWGEGSAATGGGAPPTGPTPAFLPKDWWAPNNRRTALLVAIAATVVVVLIVLMSGVLESTGDNRSLAGPVVSPTARPLLTPRPSVQPSTTPTVRSSPTAAVAPTNAPAVAPSLAPVPTPVPTSIVVPTSTPAPTVTNSPTAVPSPTPTPDLIGPSIQGVASSVDPLGTNSSDPCPVDTTVISGTIADPSGISGATLFYSAPGIADSKPMTNNGNVYSAVIGPLSVAPGQLTYRVEATDGAGNLAVSPNQSITLVPCVN